MNFTRAYAVSRFFLIIVTDGALQRTNNVCASMLIFRNVVRRAYQPISEIRTGIGDANRGNECGTIEELVGVTFIVGLKIE